MTNRYDEVALQASRWTRDFVDNREAARRLASRLIQAYAAYLGCGVDRCEYVRLDPDLEEIGGWKPILWPVPLIFQLGDWLLRFRVKFEVPSSPHWAWNVYDLSIRIVDERATVRFDDASFDFDTKDAAGPDRLLNRMYQVSLQGFGESEPTNKRLIGFSE